MIQANASLQVSHSRSKDTNMLKVKEWKSSFMQVVTKTAVVPPISISDKIDFKSERLQVTRSLCINKVFTRKRYHNDLIAHLHI